ncbi:TolC family protein [Sphingobacterium sp. LRF_L2]|uniref:TolC family protein n=1 Tax=Sphingobacterium sp. LRF_L2 TaxID=3369421 RepID=UPI003F62876B
MNFKISMLLTGLLLLLIKTNIKGQDLYTLQQCTEIALKNSLQLKSDGIDLERTNANIKQAYSALLPAININGAYQYAPNVQTSVIPAESFGGPAGQYTAAQLGIAQTKYATAELNQTLYNPSAVIALKAAKILVVGNELQIKSSQEDLVYNIAATYYSIQSLLKQEELTKLNLNNTESLLQSTKDQWIAGLATETDVDRLSVTRDNTKASLENVQNSKQKYYNLLKVLMNMKLDQVISVVEFNNNEAGHVFFVETDLQKRTNYQQVQQSKKIAELEYKNIRAGYLPTVSLFANYGYYGYHDTANPFKNINSKFYPASTVGVKFQIPVFDGFNIRYKAKNKQLEINKYAVQAEQIQQQNEKEVADAIADLNSNRITFESQKRNLELAQKVMKDINQQYQSGIVKVNDVINTTNDLQTAQNNYVTALINIKQAELSLKKAQGKLLN